MKSKFALCLLLAILVSCVSVNENITGFSLLSKRTCEHEYKDLLKRLDADKDSIRGINADTLIEFLDKFSRVYSVFYRDYQLAEWLTVLNIGDPARLSRAKKNLNNLVNANSRTFRQLHRKSQVMNKIQKHRVTLWEKTFEYDKKNVGGKGSADISDEIDEIENTILKSRKQDIQILLNQKNQFTRLFKLRNQLARLKGYRNHLYYVFTGDEIDEYTKINNALFKALPRKIAAKENISGLILPKPSRYFALVQNLVQGMGLTINKEKIKYFITHHFTYNKTFMTIIEPKNECRIYLYFPKVKLYPDEYLNFFSALVHETGHSLHFQYESTDPLIFNFHDKTVTETMAIFFENIVYSKEWLEKYFPRKLSAEEIQVILNNRKKSIIEFFRYAVFLWNYEKSIYANPDQDMAKLYKTLVVKYHLPKNNQYRLWYDTSIFASHDLYYIHYTLAYLYAFKLKKMLQRKYGPYFFENPAVGKFLVDRIFEYGRSLTRKELFTRAFGNDELPVSEYIAYLSD